MDQYRPEGKVGGDYPEIDRCLTAEEFAEARRYAGSLGLRVDERRPHAKLRRRLVVLA